MSRFNNMALPAVALSLALATQPIPYTCTSTLADGAGRMVCMLETDLYRQIDELVTVGEKWQLKYNASQLDLVEAEKQRPVVIEQRSTTMWETLGWIGIGVLGGSALTALALSVGG